MNFSIKTKDGRHIGNLLYVSRVEMSTSGIRYFFLGANMIACIYPDVPMCIEEEKPIELLTVMEAAPVPQAQISESSTQALEHGSVSWFRRLLGKRKPANEQPKD